LESGKPKRRKIKRPKIFRQKYEKAENNERQKIQKITNNFHSFVRNLMKIVTKIRRPKD
jgi:hypothetical protein